MEMHVASSAAMLVHEILPSAFERYTFEIFAGTSLSLTLKVVSCEDTTYSSDENYSLLRRMPMIKFFVLRGEYYYS